MSRESHQTLYGVQGGSSVLCQQCCGPACMRHCTARTDLDALSLPGYSRFSLCSETSVLHTDPSNDIVPVPRFIRNCRCMRRALQTSYVSIQSESSARVSEPKLTSTGNLGSSGDSYQAHVAAKHNGVATTVEMHRRLDTSESWRCQMFCI